MAEQAIREGTSPSGAAPTITLITPMYNEGAVIGSNIEQLLGVLKTLGVPWELIVVNDGSSDRGGEIVRELARREKGITLISYPDNRGRGYALKQGFARARGKYVITTESDLSWGPEIVRDLYRVLEKGGVDMVVATPYGRGGSLVNVPFHRHALSWLGNKLLCFSLGGAVTMASGMTRGYRREIIEALDLESDDKEIHLEILSQVIDLGGRIAEVPATLTWALPGSKGAARRSTFKFRKFIISHLLFSFEEYPFLLFGSIGGILLLLGTVFGLHALSLSLRGQAVGNRPLTLGAVVLILFGMQIIVFSFLSMQNRKQSKRLTRLTALLKKSADKDARLGKE